MDVWFFVDTWITGFFLDTGFGLSGYIFGFSLAYGSGFMGTVCSLFFLFARPF